jgi:HK97 family phage portal protein
LLNLLFRGNGYARIERDAKGNAYALWPMSADQTEMRVLEDGSVVYLYYVGSDIAVLSADNVLHLKEMGNGTIGLSRLDYMKSTAAEAANSQTAANKLFANGGKPTGFLMLDKILNDDQRKAVQKNFAEMATGTTSRLYVLEANMKYEQINLSPEDMQLLTTRQFGVEECCRWFGVPPVLVGHSNVTAWGSGIESLIDGFFKLTIRPALVNIEQSMRKRVMNAAQRSRYTIEFSFDGLLRASLKDRMEIYSKAVQNGLKTRNECRQLENDEPLAGGDVLTAQVNLVPVDMLGKIKPTGGSNGTQDTVAN